MKTMFLTSLSTDREGNYYDGTLISFRMKVPGVPIGRMIAPQPKGRMSARVRNRAQTQNAFPVIAHARLYAVERGAKRAMKISDAGLSDVVTAAFFENGKDPMP